jgi:hypothetical protein
MDIISAYREVGSYRGAAAMCGTTHKTVKRIIEAHQASSRGELPPPRAVRGHNYESVADLVASKVHETAGKISAKRLLPLARAADYDGSDRNFRRLVADAKREWRIKQARAGIAIRRIPQRVFQESSRAGAASTSVIGSTCRCVTATAASRPTRASGEGSRKPFVPAHSRAKLTIGSATWCAQVQACRTRLPSSGASDPSRSA